MKKFILLIGTACLPLSVSYGVLTCGICKKFSCHKRQHMVIHLAHEHYLWFCPHCQKYIVKGNERVKGNDAFRDHVAKTHGRRACLFCMTLTFKNEEAYQSHKDAVHLPPTEYKWLCFTCKKRLPTLERFVLHVFDERKLYVCPNCMQKNPDEANGKKSEFHMIGYKTENKYLAHMLIEHKKHACSRCNMQVFKDQNELFEHGKDWHMDESKGMGAPCKLCNHKFSCKADQEFHELQHAFLLFFLEQTICGYTCCVPFHKAVADTYAEVKRLGKEKWDDTYVEKIIKPAIQAVIQAVCALATHVLTGHKRCLFCENPVTKESSETLMGKLSTLTYRQIAEYARMFLQPNENAFSESTIPVYPCDMCGSALQPNRKSRLFFASIAKFPLGEGLDVQDYPFYHLEYDELNVWKNTMMPVIPEVPASEEESCFIPKKEEKDDMILGEEDEEEEEEKEEEDKKEEKTEA